MTTTPPPVDPRLESLPGASVSAREQLAIARLRLLAQAETIYFSEHGSYGTVEELIEAGVLNRTPDGSGYTIELTVTNDGAGFVVEAVPTEYGPDGRRSFYVDEKGVVRGGDHEGGAPDPDDPPV